MDMPAERSRFREVLERRASWIDALIILSVTASAFVVLGFLARYFSDYFRLILIFFLAWLVAFLVSPVADWIQRHLPKMPRPIAVIAVIVPVILICALIIVRVIASVAGSFVALAESLPSLVAHPPAILDDIQAWLDGLGVKVDVVATFQSFAKDLLAGMSDLMVGVLGGVAGAASNFIDAIVIISLAVFMAIDKDKILRFGIDLTPPERRHETLLFRQRIGSAFAGFIRSQLMLGALYAVWAFLVCLLFGLPFGAALAVLSGLIMAIPIYGPYVSWLPPVLVAFLFVPDVVVPVAVVMLVGWFIDENILAPLVRAGALQIHPIVVTFAFLLGAQLAGAIGAVIAIPLAAVVQAFVMEYLERYRSARGWPGPDDDTAPTPTPAATAPTDPPAMGAAPTT